MHALDFDIGGYQLVLRIKPAGIVAVYYRKSAGGGPALLVENGPIVEPFLGWRQVVHSIAGLFAGSTANAGC